MLLSCGTLERRGNIKSLTYIIEKKVNLMIYEAQKKVDFNKRYFLLE